MTDSAADTTTMDLGADHEERKRLNFWHRGRAPINKAILRCGRELTVPTKLVFLYLLERAGDGVVHARQGTICDEIGCDEKTLRKALAALEERGFITSTARPDQRQALQYSINLEAIYAWVDSGKTSRNLAGGSPATEREDLPQLPGKLPATHTDQEKVTLKATSDSASPRTHARTREAVDTIRLQLGKPADELLGEELRLIIEAHGADLVLETAARMGLQGPPGQRKPWPSALLKWLPEHPALALKGPRVKKLPPSLIKPYLLPAEEVRRRNTEASEKSALQAWADIGATEEEVAEYERLVDAGEVEKSAAYLKELVERGHVETCVCDECLGRRGE